MITLIDGTFYRPGSLWFVIPDNLQAATAKWLCRKINNEVTFVSTRKAYRELFTKASAKEKYSQSIHAVVERNLGYVDFYTLYGQWRVGDRGISTAFAEEIKADILKEIESYADIFAQTA